MKKKVIFVLLGMLIISSVGCLIFHASHLKNYYDNVKFYERNLSQFDKGYIKAMEQWMESMRIPNMKNIAMAIMSLSMIFVSIIFSVVVIKRERLLNLTKEEKLKKEERKERCLKKKLLQLNAKIEKLNNKNEKSGE